VQLWQKGMQRPEIPKRDFLDEETVFHILRQCGLKPEEIAAFLREAIN